MAGTTLAEAEEMRAIYLLALKAVSKGKSYTVEENDSKRLFTRFDLSEVKDLYEYWNNECKKLSSTRRRSGYLLV